jgi:hypothetical protein
VLVGSRYRKVGENHKEDEDVIDGEGLFDKIPGQELQRYAAAEPIVDPEVEQQGKSNPENAPAQCLSDSHDMRLTMKHTQV